MSHVTDNSTGLLIEALFENLEPTKRVRVLAQTLERTIGQCQDQASVELILRLHDAFGLDPSLNISFEAEKRGVSRDEIEIERTENRAQFCDLLMVAYPQGSIRKKDDRAYPDAKPDFMGTRKEILKHVAWEWDGKLGERRKRLFGFLLRALGPGEDQVQLLDQEKQMVLSVIRERLRNASLFTEAVLRGWMCYVDETGLRRVWEDELYMLLAVARVRNGGVGSARYDINLRRREENRTAA